MPAGRCAADIRLEDGGLFTLLAAPDGVSFGVRPGRPIAPGRRGLFEMDAVEVLIRDHQAGADRDQALWNLLVLELWLRAYLDPAPVRAGV